MDGECGGTMSKVGGNPFGRGGIWAPTY